MKDNNNTTLTHLMLHKKVNLKPTVLDRFSETFPSARGLSPEKTQTFIITPPRIVITLQPSSERPSSHVMDIAHTTSSSSLSLVFLNHLLLRDHWGY